MKILMINGIFGSKSSGRSMADIKANLEKHGDEVYVATPTDLQGPSFYRIGTPMDYKLHSLLSRLTGKQAYFSQAATAQFCRYIDQIRPDIVHMQVIHGNYLCFPMLMKHLAKQKIPCVFVLDDCWYFTGKCCHYIGNGCTRWKTGCGRCPRIHDDNPSWLFDRSASIYQDKKRAFAALPRYAVVAVSDWLKGEASQSFLSGANILTRVYNAIDLNKFTYRESSVALKRELGLEQKKIILGVAAAWADRNGLSKGLGLFKELASMLPEDYTILLVGHMNADAALPGNIKSIPFVDGAEELSRYYSMADVFIQMSSIETFGKVTAEALACGTPVIVFDATANPELVGEGCGYVVPDQNIEAVYQKVQVIIQNGKSNYSNHCRSFAKSNFDSEKNAAAFVELYQKLLN